MNYLKASERLNSIGKNFLFYLIPLSITLQWCDNMSLWTAKTEPKTITKSKEGVKIYQYSHFRVEKKWWAYTAYIEEWFTPKVFAERKYNTIDWIWLCISVWEEVFTVWNRLIWSESEKIDIIVEKKSNPWENRK